MNRGVGYREEAGEEEASEIEKGVEGKRFSVFSFLEDEEGTVTIEEVEKVDFANIILHLSLGGSVFLTPERTPERSINSGKVARIRSPPALLLSYSEPLRDHLTLSRTHSHRL